MIRPSEERLPTIFVEHDSSIATVTPDASTGGWILMDTGEWARQTGVLTVDITQPGLGGYIDTPRAIDRMYVYATSAGGDVDVICSRTDPVDAALTGYSPYRYLGPLFTTTATKLYGGYTVGDTWVPTHAWCESTDVRHLLQVGYNLTGETTDNDGDDTWFFLSQAYYQWVGTASGDCQRWPKTFRYLLTGSSIYWSQYNAFLTSAPSAPSGAPVIYDTNKSALMHSCTLNCRQYSIEEFALHSTGYIYRFLQQNGARAQRYIKVLRAHDIYLTR